MEARTPPRYAASSPHAVTNFRAYLLDEARAYLAHPVLGPRLILCTETVLAVEGRSLQAIFGSPDDLKFCSSMTLFTLAAGEVGSVFKRALDRYCASRLDERTVALCDAGAG